MLRFLYTDTFSDLAHDDEDGQEWKRLPMNVKVYEIADKYGLKKLANLALPKFKSCFRRESPGFLEAIRLVSVRPGAWRVVTSTIYAVNKLSTKSLIC